MQSLIAYWFHVTYGVPEATLGVIFFVANLLSAASSLAAARIAARIGLINTMVFTHIPSSLCLIVAAFVPDLYVALALLLLRAALSQMDVPTRTSYVMAVVTPAERPAAASFTAVPRSIASAITPSMGGALFSAGFQAMPLILAGTLKTIYDLLLSAKRDTHEAIQHSSVEGLDVILV